MVVEALISACASTVEGDPVKLFYAATGEPDLSQASNSVGSFFGLDFETLQEIRTQRQDSDTSSIRSFHSSASSNFGR